MRHFASARITERSKGLVLRLGRSQPLGVGSNCTSDTFFMLSFRTAKYFFPQTVKLMTSSVRMAERSKALRSGRSLLL